MCLKPAYIIISIVRTTCADGVCVCVCVCVGIFWNQPRKHKQNTKFFKYVWLCVFVRLCVLTLGIAWCTLYFLPWENSNKLSCVRVPITRRRYQISPPFCMARSQPRTLYMYIFMYMFCTCCLANDVLVLYVAAISCSPGSHGYASYSLL
jgi:hypothetical protein